LLELLFVLLVGLLIVGLIYWVASLLLPHPIPVIVAVIGIILLLLVILQGDYTACTGRHC